MTGIKKLKSGRYQARYFAGYDGAGRRNYPSRTFSHYSDAAKWRTARIREKDLGQQIETTRMTVGEYLDQWLTSKSDLRTNTIKTYTGAMKYIKPYLGGVPLQSLRPNHLEKWQQDLMKFLAVSTIRMNRTVFNTALKKAVRLRYIHINPMDATDAPRRVKSKTPRSLDREQAQRFIAACKGQRWGLSYKLALATGLRPEEIHGLKWSYLDLEGSRGRVSVEEVIVRLPGGGWQFESPKSQSSYRSIMFGGEIIKELKAYRAEQLEQRMALGRSWHDNDLVFTTTIGTPVNRADHAAQFRKIVKLAGIKESFRLYDLRHSFATLSLLAGVDFKTVSQELGHANAAFTLDTYAHVLKEMEVRSSDKRERLLRVKK